ncbi:MAG: GGDEF domain-containing protein [Spirochaetes bacterium]|nr:GGDEF domain-containing protein [Spirochaetota bacterium]
MFSKIQKWAVVGLMAAAFIAINVFFVFVYWQGMVHYPAVIASFQTITADVQRYAKLEVAGTHDEKLVKEIDASFAAFFTDVRTMKFIDTMAINDRALEVKKTWIDLKSAVNDYRAAKSDASSAAVIAASEQFTASGIERTSAGGLARMLLLALIPLMFINSFIIYVVIWRLRLRIVDRLTHFITHDPLTGILNRLSFEQFLEKEINGYADHFNVHHSSLIMFDIDQFRALAKARGQGAADDVLRYFVQVVRQHIRRTDIFARLQDDQFIIVSLGSDGERALGLAEKLRSIIASASFDGAGTVTASVGVSELKVDDSSASAITRVTKAVHESMKLGGNKTVLR